MGDSLSSGETSSASSPAIPAASHKRAIGVSITFTCARKPPISRSFLRNEVDVIHIGRERVNVCGVTNAFESKDDICQVISRKHAEIMWAGDQLQVVDKRSRTGTYFFGRSCRLTPDTPYPISNDTFLEFGKPIGAGSEVLHGSLIAEFEYIYEPELVKAASQSSDDSDSGGYASTLCSSSSEVSKMCIDLTVEDNAASSSIETSRVGHVGSHRLSDSEADVADQLEDQFVPAGDQKEDSDERRQGTTAELEIPRVENEEAKLEEKLSRGGSNGPVVEDLAQAGLSGIVDTGMSAPSINVLERPNRAVNTDGSPSDGREAQSFSPLKRKRAEDQEEVTKQEDEVEAQAVPVQVSTRPQSLVSVSQIDQGIYPPPARRRRIMDLNLGFRQGAVLGAFVVWSALAFNLV